MKEEDAGLLRQSRPDFFDEFVKQRIREVGRGTAAQDDLDRAVFPTQARFNQGSRAWAVVDLRTSFKFVDGAFPDAHCFGEVAATAVAARPVSADELGEPLVRCIGGHSGK